MAKRVLIQVCAVVFLTVAGCGGAGEVVDLQLQLAEVGVDEESNAGLRVAVAPFEDSRTETERLGTWINYWGTERDFQIAGGPGEVAAQLFVDLLNAQGWTAELVKPGAEAPKADVMVSGTIAELSVEATGSFGYTEVMVNNRIAVRAVNSADKTELRLTLIGSGSQGVFWFDPEDAEEIVNKSLTKSFAKFSEDTTATGRLLRLK